MYDLLAELLTYVTAQMITIPNPPLLGSVQVMDLEIARQKLNWNDLPVLLIYGAGEQHIMGPENNMALERYQIDMWLITYSSDTLAYLLDPIGGSPPADNTNIFKLSQTLKEKLYQKKLLTSSVFQMGFKWDVRDATMVIPKAGLFSARNIKIEYDKDEAYTGMRNDQPGISPTAFNME